MLPEGFDKFSFIPKLPIELDHLYLKEIHAFGKKFDIFIDRESYRIETDGRIINQGKNGRRVIINF